MHTYDLAALHYMRYRVQVDGGAQHLHLGVLFKLVTVLVANPPQRAAHQRHHHQSGWWQNATSTGRQDPTDCLKQAGDDLD
jgi:hypothetical protein